MLRIAINGYGRIGRCLVRALFERELHQQVGQGLAGEDIGQVQGAEDH